MYTEVESFYFWGLNKKQRSCYGRAGGGGGGAKRPFWRVSVPKKTGAPKARARTPGQNPENKEYEKRISQIS
jgi:hypothetical protein